MFNAFKFCLDDFVMEKNNSNNIKANFKSGITIFKIFLGKKKKSGKLAMVFPVYRNRYKLVMKIHVIFIQQRVLRIV